MLNRNDALERLLIHDGVEFYYVGDFRTGVSVGLAVPAGRRVTAPMLFAPDSVAVRPAETASPTILSVATVVMQKMCATTPEIGSVMRIPQMPHQLFAIPPYMTEDAIASWIENIGIILSKQGA